jgi:hypothetical protein
MTELKHADVIVHMARHGYGSIEGSSKDDKGMFISADESWNPIVRPDADWRIKPATITYSVTVPEPMRVMPKDCESYWFLSNGAIACTKFIAAVRFDRDRFHAGNCWDTEAKAQQAFEALFGPLRAVK